MFISKMQLLIFLIIIKKGVSNLICNGDFQNYHLSIPITTDGVQYRISLFTNNYSCWWASEGSVVQIIKTQYGTGTQSADLSGTFLPYDLCQYVNLIIGTTYNLSMDVTSFPRIKTATVWTYLNDQLILTTINQDYTIIEKGNIQFTALVSRNKICFKGSAVLKSFVLIHDYTLVIDNVILVPIPWQGNGNISMSNINETNVTSLSNTNYSNITDNSINKTTNIQVNNFTDSSYIPFNINYTQKQQSSYTFYFDVAANDMEGIVYLKSTTVAPLIFLSFFKSYLKITIQGQLQQKYILYLTSEGFLNAIIYCERSYKLQSLALYFPQMVEVQNVYIKAKFYVNGRQVNFYFISNDMRDLLGTVENILNFFTLTLLFYYLNIPTQPSFSHNFLEKFCQIIYLQNSLSATLNKLTKNSIFQQTFNFSTFVSRSNGKQKIQMFYRNYAWFGKMGLTYNYFQNNFQIILILTFLILKHIIFHFLIKLFKKLSKALLDKQFNSKKYFVVDFIAMTPIMVISAGELLIQFGYDNTKQNINSVLQILTLFVILILKSTWSS